MKISIKWVLIFAFTSILSISIAFISISTYYTSKNALLTHAKEVMENIITFTIDKSKNHILVAKDATELTMGLTSSSVVNSENFDGMEKYFLEQLKINNQFSNIYYGNHKGEFIMASRSEESPDKFTVKKISLVNDLRVAILKTVDDSFATIGLKPLPDDKYDPRIRPWYEAVKKQKKIIWTEPYIFFSSKKPGITSAAPVLNEDNHLIGSIGVDIEINELSEFISKMAFSEKGKVVIFDEKKNMIASGTSNIIHHSTTNNELRLAKIDDMQDAVLDAAFSALLQGNTLDHIDKKIFLTFDNGGEKYHAIFSPFKVNDIKWIIGICVAENAYLGGIKNNQILNIYIAILIALISIFLSYKISTSIARPISQMQKVANELKLHHLDIPKIPLSSFSEISESVEAFNEMKDELIRYEKETNDLNNNLESAYLDTLYRLALAAEHRDSETTKHVHRIGTYTEIIATEMNMNEHDTHIIKHASLMHDVGKLGIPDSILLKPGKLTSAEMDIMKTHSVLGGKILADSDSEIMQAACQIAIYHHEKFDGSGYPYGLKGEDIPLMARIVAVVDVFDALISKRCYKEAFSVEKAVGILKKGRGNHFDPACIDAFWNCFAEIEKLST